MSRIFRDLKPGEPICQTHEGVGEVYVCRQCLEELEAHSLAVQGYHDAMERQRHTIRSLEKTIQDLMVENEILKRLPPDKRHQ